MRLTVIAAGSRGDVQPLLALAAGLQAAGHAVRVATHPEFETPAREQGLDFFRLNSSPSQLMQSPAMRAAMGGNRNPVVMARGILKTIEPQFAQGLAEIRDACIGTNADALLVSMLGFLGGCHVAEKLGIPCYEAYVLPVTPTRAFPSPILGTAANFGGLGNRLSWMAMGTMSSLLITPLMNRARRAVLDLPPVSFARLMREREARHMPVLYGFSRHVLPKPPDWAPWHHVTGYWFLKRPGHWQPPPALVDFLESGPPPVYVGFGSMTGRDPERIASITLEALARAGQRGVLATGWGGLRLGDLPRDVFTIDAVPHDWLLPHMAAVVHHGGSGTTAAGLRAGAPSILVPFGGDQYLWGRRVHALGVGPAPIVRPALTAERLAAGLRRATGDAEMRARAAALGECLRAEDGVARAVAVLGTA